MQNTTGLERRKTDRVGSRAASGIRALFGSAMAALLLWPLVSVTALGASGEPILDWAINTKTSTTQWPGPVTMDPAGNIVVTGVFQNTVTFGEASGVTVTTGHNYGIYVARYRPDGSAEWAVSAGGPNWMWMSQIAVNAHGDIVVIGSYRGAIMFGEGTDAVTLDTGSPTTWGYFFARYRSDGALDWAKAVPGSIFDVALDDEGDVFITGSFAGQVTFGTGSHAVTLDSDPGATWPRSAAFLARYKSDGTLVWAKMVGNQGAGQAVSVHSDGSMFVTGVFYGSSGGSTITLGTGDEAVTLTSSGSYGTFLAKFSGDGSLVWARGSSGTAWVSLRSIAVDVDGHVFVGGSIGWGDATFGGITIDKPYYLEPTYCERYSSILLLRYSPDGDVDWAVTNEPGPRYYEDNGYGCDWQLSPSQAYVMDIALTSDGDPLLAGYFNGQVVFGEDDEALVRTSPYDGWGSSAFLARYRGDGTLDWLTTPAGDSSESVGRNVASDAAKNIVFAGDFWGTITFSSGGTTASLPQSSSGGHFLARFKPQSEVRTVACMGFESPADRDLLVRRANRVIPLSITLLDGNQFVTGGEIAPPLVSRAYQGSGNLASGELEELNYRGEGDDGNRFLADGSGWVFNLSTSGFSKGTHTITVGSGDSSQYVVEPTCSVQVVIQ